MLVQHQAYNKSVFLTKDDYHDIATIMLFQAYTSNQLAEFVYLLKGKASEDPLSKREETNKKACPRKAAQYDYNNNSNADNKLECDDDSNVKDDPRSDDDVLFDFKDNSSNDGATDKDIDERSCLNKGYNSNGTDIIIIKDIDKCYIIKVDECKQPLQQNLNPIKPSKFEEAKRKYKALYYKDICFQIVQNPKRGEKDLLAIEVYLQNYKRVNNKLKLYVTLIRYLKPQLI